MSRNLSILCFSILMCVSLEGKSQDLPSTDQKVDTLNLRPGPVRHVMLTEVQLTRIKKVQAIFADVDSMQVDRWIDDFKRDLNPDSEIEVYEAMADAYMAYSKDRVLSQAAKNDLYKVLIMRSCVPDSVVLSDIKLTVLKRKDIIDILSLYKAKPKPITYSSE